MLEAHSLWMGVATWTALAALAGLLIAACITDLRERLIPNRIPLGIAGVWLLWKAISFAATPTPASATVVDSVVGGLLGALAIGGGMLAFALLFERLTGRSSMGGGDIKLMAACALYLGIQRSILCLAIACALGILLAAIIPHTRFARIDERAGAMPFGPAIALATLITLLL